jgi:hypothetical protein
MRNLLALFLAMAVIAYAQEESTESFYLIPSAFYTNGDYSTDAKSNSIAVYNALQLAEDFFLINHYEYLSIDNKDYNYIQQAFLAGGIVDLFPYYIKFNYVHYKGDFDYKLFDYKYNDYTNLYNLDFIYFINLFYLGAAYTRLNQIGFAKIISNQVTLRLEKILSNYVFISLKPNFTRLDNGKNLFSISAKLHYAPATGLLVKVGGFIGERAFYFDSDILTIFNQNSIQKYQIFGQVEYSPIQQLSLILGYQQTQFEDFKINYMIAGIKGNFQIAK